MKTKIINLFGGPGVGKSTVSAALFVHLKQMGKEVELVREFAKDLVWEGRPMDITRQFYIFGKQTKREIDLYNKVEFIITDSPLMLSHVYYNLALNKLDTNDHNRTFINNINELKKIRSEITEFNYILQRDKEYKQNGRNETEDQAISLDQHIKNILDSEKIENTVISGPCKGKAEEIIAFLKKSGNLIT